MLSKKKVGDTLFVVCRHTTVPPRNESIVSVGRLYIKTLRGDEYLIADGTMRAKKGDAARDARAWADEESYKDTLEHTTNVIKFKRKFHAMPPFEISPEKLRAVQAILEI